MFIQFPTCRLCQWRRYKHFMSTANWSLLDWRQLGQLTLSLLQCLCNTHGICSTLIGQIKGRLATRCRFEWCILIHATLIGIRIIFEVRIGTTKSYKDVGSLGMTCNASSVERGSKHCVTLINIQSTLHKIFTQVVVILRGSVVERRKHVTWRLVVQIGIGLFEQKSNHLHRALFRCNQERCVSNAILAFHVGSSLNENLHHSEA
mmetsp:Transcript_3370/g.12809  ORF Transcript_3370/g.12809 Transcript_3370/m.12809 type:complete len:205 (+) Transcript_3370:232-846(+)